MTGWRASSGDALTRPFPCCCCCCVADPLLLLTVLSCPVAPEARGLLSLLLS